MEGGVIAVRAFGKSMQLQAVDLEIINPAYISPLSSRFNQLFSSAGVSYHHRYYSSETQLRVSCFLAKAVIA